MNAPRSGWRTGLQGLALVLFLNLLVYGGLRLNRSAPPSVPPSPTPQELEARPSPSPGEPEDVAAVLALTSSDPVAVSAARVFLAERPAPSAAAIGTRLAQSCHPGLTDRIELLAADRRLTGAQAEALGHALAAAAARAQVSDPACAGRAVHALAALYGSTSLVAGAATRLAEGLLRALPPDDLLGLPLVALIDQAAPEGPPWPAALEALALDPALHVQARAAACRGVVRRRAVPGRLLEQRTTLPGPVQRCLLLSTAEQRVASSRQLLGAADVDARLAALATLHAFGEPEDVPALLARLREPLGGRERAELIETAGYLVQLNIERADGLVGRDAEPGSPEALVRARAVAGQPSPRSREDTLCDAVAKPASPLAEQVEATQALGPGARLCLPPGSTWAGDVVVRGSEVAILALGPARLQGTLRLEIASVVVGLRATRVEAAAGSALLWAGGAEVLSVDGASQGPGRGRVLSVDEAVHVPGVAASLRVQRIGSDVEERGQRGGARGWARRSAVASRPAETLHGAPPERAPQPQTGAPPATLAAPGPAPAAGGALADWVPVYGESDAGVLVPLRAADWVAAESAVFVGTAAR